MSNDFSGSGTRLIRMICPTLVSCPHGKPPNRPTETRHWKRNKGYDKVWRPLPRRGVATARRAVAKRSVVEGMV